MFKHLYMEASMILNLRRRFVAGLTLSPLSPIDTRARRSNFRKKKYSRHYVTNKSTQRTIYIIVPIYYIAEINPIYAIIVSTSA